MNLLILRCAREGASKDEAASLSHLMLTCPPQAGLEG
jgi:hypothetical protein